MKRGFTLVELLAVIAILGVIALVAIPVVDRALDEGKDKILETQKAQIIKGAKDYLAINTDKLPSSGNTITLTVGQLQADGYLQLEIRNPKSDDYVAPTAQVQVKAVGNGYQYTVLENTMSGSSSVTDGPTIVLNGGNVQYVEVKTPYVDKGYVATTSEGVPLTTTTIIENELGSQVSQIDTTTTGTYTVTYYAVEGDKTTTAVKTVMVVDTTKPVLNVADINISGYGKNEIPANMITSFDFSSLATATDNYATNLIINYTSNVSQIKGNYTITYYVEDYYGNRASKTLTVSVVDAIEFSATDANVYADSKKITIKYPKLTSITNQKNQYSIDGGITWVDVSGTEISFEVSKTTTVVANVLQGNDSIMSATYTLTKFNN